VNFRPPAQIQEYTMFTDKIKHTYLLYKYRIE